MRKRKTDEIYDSPEPSTSNLAQSIQQAAADVVKQGNSLPTLGQGFELYASFTEYSEFMCQQRRRILILLRKLLAANGYRANISDDFLGDMSRILPANDLIADQINASIDEYQAKILESANFIRAQKLTPAAELISNAKKFIANPTESHIATEDSLGRYKILSKTTIISEKSSSAQTLIKPQLQFQEFIDNTSIPFVHKPKVKHNAKELKKISNLRYVESTDDVGTSLTADVMNEYNEEPLNSEHPYLSELNSFQIPSEYLEYSTQKDPLPINETELVYVDTLDLLEKLIEELKLVSEFSFDLEHHELRTFLGLTCLLQISTRNVDYIVDPFPLWKHMHLLNEVFSNPKILKVAHSAENDIIWLQRDFGIYTINLFDTRCAMRLLHSSKQSLKHLLETLFAISPNKALQRADWRIRPLTEAMILYARTDTHYLLYCYDRLKHKLMSMNNSGSTSTGETILYTAFKNSHRLTYTLYERPLFDELGYMKLLHTRRRFNNRQIFALKELWKWRDRMAREQDESLQYVLPDHMMLHIAEVLPKEMQGILACCNPIPPLVRNELTSLYRIVRVARDLQFDQSGSRQTENASRIEADAESLFRNSTFEANRITKLKAKLEYHFDYNTQKSDDILPSVEAVLERNNIVAVDIDDLSDTNTRFVFPSVFSITDREHNTPTPQTKFFINQNTDTKIKEITSKLEKWGTPYDAFLLAVNRRESSLLNNSDEGPSEDQLIRYSHIDSGNNHVKIENVPATTTENNNRIVVSSEKEVVLSQHPEIFTKKARKLLNKSNKKAAAISLL